VRDALLAAIKQLRQPEDVEEPTTAAHRGAVELTSDRQGVTGSPPLVATIKRTAIRDWDHHIAKIADFWSSVVLRTGRYDGRPMRPHLMLPLKGDRWLILFEQTASEIFSADVAEIFISRARRIADSFEMGIASTRGEVAQPLDSWSAATELWAAEPF
jgi:hemoglobin